MSQQKTLAFPKTETNLLKHAAWSRAGRFAFTCLLLGSFLVAGPIEANDKLKGLRGAVRAKEAAKPSPAKPSSHRSKNKRADPKKKKNSIELGHASNASSPSRSNANRTPKNQTGKLASVRQAVRQQPERVPPSPPRHHPSRDNQRHRAHTHHHRNNHRNHIHSSRAGFCPSPVFFGPSPVFFPEPVFVPEPVYVEPVVIVEQTPGIIIQPSVEQPLVEPNYPMPSLVTSPSPVTDVVVPQTIQPPPNHHRLAQVGGDWFDQADSRLWASLGSDFDGLSSGSFGLLLQSPEFFGLETSVSTLRESGTRFRDNLWIGDVNLVYQVIKLPRLKTRLGVGVNWLGDAYGGDAGFNLTAGVDLKLNNRWTLSGESDLGTLGDADLFHGKISLNRRFESVDWTLGYEHYDIGGAKIGMAFTGIGIRF